MTIADFVLIGGIAVILLYDAWAARRGEGYTMSFHLAVWSRQWPIIPLLAGILLGHLFFPNRGYCQ